MIEDYGSKESNAVLERAQFYVLRWKSLLE